jgi:hypothetical protein
VEDRRRLVRIARLKLDRVAGAGGGHGGGDGSIGPVGADGTDSHENVSWRSARELLSSRMHTHYVRGNAAAGLQNKEWKDRYGNRRCQEKRGRADSLTNN